MLFLSVRKMFGARKRGLIQQKLEIIRFFPLFYFYLDPNVSLKQQKNSNFLFKTRKILFWPIRESLCFKFREFFGSRKFLLAKDSAPKVSEEHDLIYILISFYSRGLKQFYLFFGF